MHDSDTERGDWQQSVLLIKGAKMDHRNFGVISKHAEWERKRTFNPKAASPPIGDWPRDPRDTFQPIPQDRWLPKLILYLLVTLVLFVGWTFLVIAAFSRDLDGRYAKQDPKIHAWFDQLASGKGLCCSFADGFSIQDVDWDTQDGRYRVRLHGEWIIVPENALVTEPNRFGPAVVWPYTDAEGSTQIRCFLPGAGA